MEEKKSKYNTRSAVIELYIWLILASIIAVRPFLSSNNYWKFYNARAEFNAQEFVSDYYWLFIIAIFTFVFPFIFRLIYAKYPFEYLRFRNHEHLLLRTNSLNINENSSIAQTEKLLGSDYNLEETNLNNSNDIQTILRYLKQSQNISEKIYTRSGAYLLIGCLIAFAGVLFFSFQSTYLHQYVVDPRYFDFSRTILEFLPRIGTLIFIEAIAFFFLRQYRVTMEEYRYYEAIKRQRENQYAILKIVQQHKDKPDMFDKIIEKCAFGENPNKLAQYETTQLLEANKLNVNDTDFMDKLIEIIKVAKK